jgi:hypothetical protein
MFIFSKMFSFKNVQVSEMFRLKKYSDFQKYSDLEKEKKKQKIENQKRKTEK